MSIESQWTKYLCVIFKTCRQLMGQWGLAPEAFTGAQPLDPAGRLPFPDPLICPPLVKILWAPTVPGLLWLQLQHANPRPNANLTACKQYQLLPTDRKWASFWRAFLFPRQAYTRSVRTMDVIIQDVQKHILRSCVAAGWRDLFLWCAYRRWVFHEMQVHVYIMVEMYWSCYLHNMRCVKSCQQLVVVAFCEFKIALENNGIVTRVQSSSDHEIFYDYHWEIQGTESRSVIN